MKRFLILAMVLLFAAVSCQQSTRPKDFGKQWVRSHPFAMMGLVLNKKRDPAFDLAQYQAQNYSFLLAWRPRSVLYEDASKTGYPWFLNLTCWGGPTDEFKNKARDIMAQYPGNVGLYVNDEPTLHGRYREGKPIVNTFEGTAKVLQWTRKTWPEKLVLSNIGGDGGGTRHYYGTLKDYTPEQEEEMKHYAFSEYLRDYLLIVKPDVLMFDAYIFNYGEGNESGVTPYWYQSLWLHRKEALKAGVPYWAWMTTWDRPSKRGYNIRLASESDYRMNVFSVLTYGFTGIADYTYSGIHERGVLMPDCTPSPLYEHSAKVHAEVANIGQTLRFLTSTDIALIPGFEQSRIPPFHKKWEPGTGDDDHIKSISIVGPGEYVRGKKGLIGYFRDDHGNRYFMLTNLFQRAETSAKDCELKFQITFDPATKEIYRLSRETGQVERLEIVDSDKGLLITLPGGTGDLFKYDNGNFVGLDK